MACGRPPVASVIAAATWPAPCPSGRCSSSTNRAGRSTSAPTADLPPAPMIRSPSHWPGTARSCAPASRSLIPTMPGIPPRRPPPPSPRPPPRPPHHPPPPPQPKDPAPPPPAARPTYPRPPAQTTGTQSRCDPRGQPRLHNPQPRPDTLPELHLQHPRHRRTAVLHHRNPHNQALRRLLKTAHENPPRSWIARKVAEERVISV